MSPGAPRPAIATVEQAGCRATGHGFADDRTRAIVDLGPDVPFAQIAPYQGPVVGALDVRERLGRKIIDASVRADIEHTLRQVLG